MYALCAAADELVGAAAHRAHQDPVGAAFDGVGSEHHTADGRGEHRLHQHRHAVARQPLWRGRARRPDPPRGGEHGADRRVVVVPAAHIQHRFEMSCHRGPFGVLVEGGGPHDERPLRARPAGVRQAVRGVSGPVGVPGTREAATSANPDKTGSPASAARALRNR